MDLPPRATQHLRVRNYAWEHLTSSAQEQLRTRWTEPEKCKGQDANTMAAHFGSAFHLRMIPLSLKQLAVQRTHIQSGPDSTKEQRNRSKQEHILKLSTPIAIQPPIPTPGTTLTVGTVSSMATIPGSMITTSLTLFTPKSTASLKMISLSALPSQFALQLALLEESLKFKKKR